MTIAPLATPATDGCWMTCRFLVLRKLCCLLKKRCRGVAIVHWTFFFQYSRTSTNGRLSTTATVFGGHSIHWLLLPIESGRYKRIPGVERLCPLCNRSETGDEFHYLLKCTHSSLSHIRAWGIFLESLYSINSNFTNMSCKALFLYIMSMCDENIINLSASYTENILNCYASEL